MKVQPIKLYSYVRLDYQSRLTVLVLSEPNSTCTDDGAVMMNGSSWFRADCSRCRCESGLIFCDSQGLPLAGEPNCTPLPPDCTLSRVPPGQCCPVCVSKYDSNITLYVLNKTIAKCWYWLVLLIFFLAPTDHIHVFCHECTRLAYFGWVGYSVSLFILEN